ncbi:AAA family ATPase (macronuclear) [Tetrahymena thermophila SB210]|uniref:Replication factor C subunit 1 n=1 Tax=Tetrahymena thermophila (strain SB210) TaxID=312017 RepID=I7M476_TETTS|nr:AAA family ATPase [Tetrahymena thermophila SB210]EAS05103.2 AAA family ATPase [Tetrahymena thermophila SB210]|eukprot:XP_001025348.2 AAA family ATPase [Tetrahymena thermophila SB210]
MSGSKKQQKTLFEVFKGKENNKSVSPKHVDPKKQKLLAKIINKPNQKMQEEEKNTMSKKKNQKDEILDQKRGRKPSNPIESREQSNSPTPIKNQKKNNKAADHEVEKNKEFTDIQNTQHVKKQQLKTKTNENYANKSTNNNRDIETEEELTSPKDEIKAKGIKKQNRLMKISEKVKANPKKQNKKIPILISDQEDSDDESEQGEVEYVDDQVDNLQQNKRVDQMFKNNQKKIEFQSKGKKEEPEQKQGNSLLAFLQPQDLQQDLENMKINEQDKQDKQDDEINEDEEEIRRLDQLIKLKQESILISDSPIKTNNQVRQKDENQMEIEEAVQQEQEQENSIQEISEEAFVPKNLKNKTFYFLGQFKEFDIKIIKLAIEDNEGKVINKEKQGKDHYNVIGNKNVSFNDMKNIKEKQFPYQNYDDFVSLVEKTLGMKIENIITKYKQIQENGEPKQKKDTPIQNINQQQKQQIQTAQTAAFSQKVNQQNQKTDEKANKKIQNESQSSLSGLASFLPPSAFIQQDPEIVEDLNENEYHVNDKMIKSEAYKDQNSKDSNQADSEKQNMSNSVPFFTKKDLKKPQTKAICKIDEEPQIINEINKQESMEVEVEYVKKIKNTQKPFMDHHQAQLNKKKQNQENSIHSLWTHKYAPQELNDCVGNEAQIKKLENWLVNWENVVVHKQKVQGNWKENPGSRACLISGPPGIGKTSTVRLLAQKYNMNIIEWNASDVRNKNAIETIINPLKDNTVLNFKHEVSSQRSIILMDEVDGMSSGDIGGNQALMKIIKETKNPIFCVCNDRYSQKLRSLASICFDVRFYKPNKGQIAKRLLEVCRKEGLKSELNHLEFLAESVNNDIRQALNLLQMQSKKSKDISFKSLVQGLSSFKKDDQVSMSAFEAAKILMTKVEFDRKKQISQKVDLFFLDYELVPMLIHENYLSTFQSKEYNRTSVQELERIADATCAMAESDLLQDSIRSGGNWSLLQNVGFLTSVYVPQQVCSKCNTYPQMTQHLGKFSSQRKTSRLIRQLRMQLAQNISGNRQAVQFDYINPLMELILYQLENNGKQGVDNVISIMEEYNITPDLLKEHFITVPYKSDFEQRLKDIPTTIKTNLTKTYNKRFKDDVKPDKKTKKSEDEEHHVKYDDVLGEIDEVEIDEEEQEDQQQQQQKEDEETKNNIKESKQSKETQKKSDINKQQLEEEKKAQTIKSTKTSTKEVKSQPEQKNNLKSFFLKNKK